MDTPIYLTREYYQDRRPLKRSWPDVDPPATVRSTDGVPFTAPSAVTLLAAQAELSGWEVRTGYSRGTPRAVKIGTYKDVEAIGVWAWHPVTGWRFTAIHARTVGGDWAWRVSIWKPGVIGSRFVHANVTDLKEAIAVQGEVGPAWFKGVHARVMEQKERERAKARKGKGGS